MDQSPSPIQPLPSPAPRIIEESSYSPTVQALQEAKRTFPYRSVLLLVVAILPIFYGINLVASTVKNLEKRAAKTQELIERAGQEDLLTTSETEETEITYTNPLDETEQYENPFEVSAYSNPFDQ
jgi:hypothetical protein